MPSIPLLNPSSHSSSPSKTATTPSSISNPLPRILHTPSGLALLELQGSVLTSTSPTSSEEISQAINLGRLVFPSSTSSSSGGSGGGEWDGKRVFLFVGKHQRMAGEVRKLGRAIAVVRRKISVREGEGRDGRVEGEGVEVEVEVEAIVKYKMVFGSRPEPMGAEQQQQQGDEVASV